MIFFFSAYVHMQITLMSCLPLFEKITYFFSMQLGSGYLSASIILYEWKDEPQSSSKNLSASDLDFSISI